MLRLSSGKIASFAAVAFLTFIGDAHADVVAGSSCTQLGQTMMATNRRAIVGCLLSTADGAAKECNGNCVWKVMSGSGGRSGGSGSCPTGFKVFGNSDNPLGCIQEAENASATQTAAMVKCYAAYGGRLPVGGELYAATRQHNLAVGAGASPYGKHRYLEWIDSVYLLPDGSLGGRGIDSGAASTYAGEPYYPSGVTPPVEWAMLSANGNSYGYRCYLPLR